VLLELRRLGVCLAVDDFGTGYSSLSHLANLPIDMLKIDRSFVARLEIDSKEAAVVRSIMLLGSSLGKEIVAEGIETPSQLEQLRAMGCGFGQGFLLANPLTATQATDLLLRGPVLNLAAHDDRGPPATPKAAMERAVAAALSAGLDAEDRAEAARESSRDRPTVY